MKSWLGLVVVGSVGLFGCSGVAGGGEGTGPSLVMLDADAREAGFSLQTPEGKVTPVAPVELSGEVSLVGPGQRIPLVGAPGELLVVTGKRGALVPHTLSTEVDADAVRVEGDVTKVRDLATRLRAMMTGEGPYELRAAGLLANLAHVDTSGVTSILPIDVSMHPEVLEAAAAADQAVAFSAKDPRFADFTGLGAHSRVCSDPLLGTWVSVPKFNTQYQDWHVMTLHVQPGDEPGSVMGSVSAHVWSGGSQDVVPGPCSEYGMNYEVSMPAVGHRGTDGALRFDAGPWTLDKTTCTGASWGYNPDHFSGVVDGRAIRTVNNDGGRSVNDPFGFERVSCE
jgi:hypothetical protein